LTGELSILTSCVFELHLTICELIVYNFIMTKPSYDEVPSLHKKLLDDIVKFVNMKTLANEIGFTMQKLSLVRKRLKQSLSPLALARIYRFCTARGIPFPDVVFVRYRSGADDITKVVVALTKEDLQKILEEDEKRKKKD